MRLTLEAVSKSYPTRKVLDAVSLDFPDVHALVLIGPSGGGKSTLLRLIAGLLEPTSGRLLIDGEPIPFQDPEALRQFRSQIGVVFQAHNLFPHLTALENVTLPLELVHGASRAESVDRAMDLLRRFQLDTHAHQHPAELSGGQQQRVAIARAAALRPKLMLLDEPTSALDPEMTAEVLDMIAELRAEGRHLVLVTHQMAFARRVADYVAFIGDGGIAAHGTPDALIGGGCRVPLVRRFLDRVLSY